MAADCKIEWVAELARQRGMAPKSWNPVIGCSRASEGCRNCYAAGIAHRFGHHGFGVYAGLTDRDSDGTPRFTGKIDFSEKRLVEPLRWRKPAVVFVGDMTDLFHDNVTDEMLDRTFAVMALKQDFLFLVLTKRPERMRRHLNDAATPIRIASASVDIAVGDMRWSNPCGTDDWWPLPNVWLGVTAENQPTADARIPHLLNTPAAKRFVSVEPMLGPINITPYIGHNAHHCRCGWHETELDGSWFAGKFTCHECGDTCSTCDALDWVICGGESGPGARPMHPGWARGLRDQCDEAGVPFFFKQWGEWEPFRGARPDDLFDARKALIVRPSGGTTSGLSEYNDDAFVVRRVGKKAAGRLLDGSTWDEVPQ